MHRISGITEEQERLYRHLLTAAGPASREHLLARFGSGVDADLDGLRMVGLVYGDPPRVRRASTVLQRALARHEMTLREFRAYVGELDRLYDASRHVPEGEPVEVLTTLGAVQQWSEEVQSAARQELMQFITHPVLPLQGAAAGGEHGAKCRVLCEWKALSKHNDSGFAHSLEAGCDIRAVERLPTRLVIADRTLAMVPRFHRGHPEARQMLLVHPGTLMDLLVAVFESEWERAVPLHTDPGEFSEKGRELDADEMLILRMLARGAHIERIAGALNVHTRTVNRRIDELKSRAGVTTLFQLGAYAARRWMNASTAFQDA